MTHNAMSIEDVPINRFHQLLTLRSGGGWFLDGYILSIIGITMIPMSESLHLSSEAQGSIAAAALFGMFFGGFVGGKLTDYLGRRRLYFVPPIIFCICSLLQLFSVSVFDFFSLRFLIGFGVGIEYPVAGSLLVEFLPRENRGPRLSMLTILWFIGAAVSYILGTVVIDYAGPSSWRLILASPAVLGALLFVLRLGTPESPRWLIKKGHNNKADTIIKSIYGPNFSVLSIPEGNSEQKVSITSFLKAGYGVRLLFVSLFWTLSIIPVFAVYAFAPQVLMSLNFGGSWGRYGAILITVMFVVGCVIATWLINVMGRRPMLIHSFLWSGLSLVAVGFFSAQSKWLILGCLAAYAVSIGGAQVLSIVYSQELFPTEFRPLASGMAASLSRLGAAAGTWLAPLSLEQFGGTYTMFIAGFLCFLGFLLSYYLAPETHRLNLDQASSLK
ncbi:MFS transporter [Acetobacter cibinongensis]|uniref:Metabolite transporter n=1 Tax=Acetobacter cibinongensis TaxID=146475 RepID=A0A1Z5YX80_9PROT|nr:MFS transporter [Acetobacter cibinongensis]OUJ03898.1 metabolite transporter [Acetobacter cibinongensis]